MAWGVCVCSGGPAAVPARLQCTACSAACPSSACSFLRSLRLCLPCWGAWLEGVRARGWLPQIRVLRRASGRSVRRSGARVRPRGPVDDILGRASGGGSLGPLPARVAAGCSPHRCRPRFGAVRVPGAPGVLGTEVPPEGAHPVADSARAPARGKRCCGGQRVSALGLGGDWRLCVIRPGRTTALFGRCAQRVSCSRFCTDGTHKRIFGRPDLAVLVECRGARTIRPGPVARGVGSSQLRRARQRGRPQRRPSCR